MIRFIAKRTVRDQGCVSEHLETLDANVPELEKFLLRGGFGGGPNGDDFDKTVLIGVEVRERE